MSGENCSYWHESVARSPQKTLFWRVIERAINKLNQADDITKDTQLEFQKQKFSVSQSEMRFRFSISNIEYQFKNLTPNEYETIREYGYRRRNSVTSMETSIAKYEIQNSRTKKVRCRAAHTIKPAHFWAGFQCASAFINKRTRVKCRF